MQQHNLAEITKRVYESATPMDKYINKKRYIVESEQIKRMDHLEVKAGNVTRRDKWEVRDEVFLITAGQTSLRATVEGVYLGSGCVT